MNSIFMIVYLPFYFFMYRGNFLSAVF